jgi:hypothetical protein
MTVIGRIFIIVFIIACWGSVILPCPAGSDMNVCTS